MTSRHAAGLIVVAGLFTLPAAAVAQKGPVTPPTGLPAEVLALACAPHVVFEEPNMPLRITGGQDATVRKGHAPGDLVTINAGSQNGITVGQEFYTRRTNTTRFGKITRDNPSAIRTTGWIRVWAVEETLSLATITHACDTVDVGDFLEPFALPVMPAVSTDRSKAQREYGRVMVGSDRRRTFGKGDFVLVDRGIANGLTPGANLVFYRDKHQKDNFLFELGEGVAVEVKPDTATLLVTVSLDAIQEGDYVALRKAPDEEKK